MMQAHLTGLHLDVLRRVDLDLGGRSLCRQVVGIGTIGVGNQTEPMRTWHDAQATVFSGR